MSARVVLVPGVLALLPEHAGLVDPVADLRGACLAAVSQLGSSVVVVASTRSGERVARSLLAATADARSGEEASYVVVANGSATRTEKAPGHLHPEAEAFDERLRAALRGPDPAALRSVDADLAREVWADTGVLAELAGLLEGAGAPEVGYDEAPYGVQYWVLSWQRPD